MQFSAKEGSTKKPAIHDKALIVIIYLVTRGVSFLNVSYADKIGFGGGGDSFVDMVKEVQEWASKDQGTTGTSLWNGLKVLPPPPSASFPNNAGRLSKIFMAINHARAWWLLIQTLSMPFLQHRRARRSTRVVERTMMSTHGTPARGDSGAENSPRVLEKWIDYSGARMKFGKAKRSAEACRKDVKAMRQNHLQWQLCLTLASPLQKSPCHAKHLDWKNRRKLGIILLPRFKKSWSLQNGLTETFWIVELPWSGAMRIQQTKHQHDNSWDYYNKNYLMRRFDSSKRISYYRESKWHPLHKI